MFLVQLKEKLAKHCLQVKECGQGVNDTRMKGKEAKNERWEKMKSWKKCRGNREGDTTTRDRNGSSSRVNEEEKKAEIVLKKQEMQ
jgi:hypothetical protein